MVAQHSQNLVYASRIRTRRIARDLTQAQLAELTGVPRDRLSAYEQDHRDITLVHAVRIAQALDCSLDQLTAPTDLLF